MNTIKQNLVDLYQPQYDKKVVSNWFEATGIVLGTIALMFAFKEAAVIIFIVGFLCLIAWIFIRIKRLEDIIPAQDIVSRANLIMEQKKDQILSLESGIVWSDLLATGDPYLTTILPVPKYNPLNFRSFVFYSFTEKEGKIISIRVSIDEEVPEVIVTTIMKTTLL